MKNVKIGKKIENKQPFELDIERLIETRLLVQAGSGGGKSYVLRKILESTHGKVQHIILDTEGEFSTLREKFDYIIVGKGGDIPADIKTAELLARKVLELRVSVIIDLYELKAHEKHIFIQRFVNSLVEAPKSLWHAALVVIDEAHLYAPQVGSSVASSAIIDLATRGRKRGFCAVLATQRISKLHKDAAAECQNKLIGRTGLDIDLKRAGDELGFSGKENILSLRDLEAGEFYGFGPAFSKAVTKVKIDPVTSTHLEAGTRIKASTPEPTAKVKQILQKLTDLPAEVQKELKDKDSMMARIKELELKLKQSPVPAPAIVKEPDIKGLTESIENKLRKEFEKVYGEKYKKDFAELKSKLINVLKEGEIKAPGKPEVSLNHNYSTQASRPLVAPTVRPVVKPQVKTSAPARSEGVEVSGIGKCERSILAFLAMRAGRAYSKVQIGAMSGYSHTSGSFNNAISKLSSLGLIVKRGSDIEVSPEQLEEVKTLLGNEYQADSRAALELWLNKLGKCPRSIYEMLLTQPDASFSKEELGEATGYSASSGSFNNAISEINTLGLCRKNSDGTISLNPEILDI